MFGITTLFCKLHGSVEDRTSKTCSKVYSTTILHVHFQLKGKPGNLYIQQSLSFHPRDLGPETKVVGKNSKV